MTKFDPRPGNSRTKHNILVFSTFDWKDTRNSLLSEHPLSAAAAHTQLRASGRRPSGRAAFTRSRIDTDKK